jgi:hypothetical protein
VVVAASAPVCRRVVVSTANRPFLFACQPNSGKVEALIRKAKRKLPLYVIGKPNEKPGA